MKKILCLWALLFSSVLLSSAPDVRMLITAGALTDNDPFAAFYQSPVFIGNNRAPFLITHADMSIFESNDFVFYSESTLTPAEIIKATGSETQLKTKSLVANSFQGFVLLGAVPETVSYHLGADDEQIAFVKRSSGSKLIYGFQKNNQKNSTWPKREEDLYRVPGVIISNEKEDFKILMRGRRIGELSHRLGLIDELTKKTPAAVIEVGGATRENSKQISSAATNAILKRKFSAMVAGINELAAIAEGKEHLPAPIIYPSEGKNQISFSRGARDINLFTLAGQEKFWPLFSKLAPLSPLESLAGLIKMKSTAAKSTLNMVRVYSEESAALAARSLDVDVVFMTAEELFVSQPRREIIELNGRSSGTSAPIIRVSYLDIHEVFVYAKDSQINKIEIIRYPINDTQPQALDVPLVSHNNAMRGFSTKKLFTSQKNLQKNDWERILGGIVLAKTGADIALFESKPEYVAIQGDISYETAKNLLRQPGHVSSFSISAKQIKNLVKLKNSGLLANNYLLYGIDKSGSKIGSRPVNENEHFTIAVSDKALLDLFGIARVGGFSDIYSNRAPFVEAIYGEIKSLYFIAGPKITQFSEMANETALAIKDIATGPSFDEVIHEHFAMHDEESFKNFIKEADGRPHHVITFDISYLDFGLSTNVTNKTYDDFNPINKPPALPMGRGAVPSFVHIFVFAKVGLTYDTPSLVSTLSGELRHMHVDMKNKPEKDKVKIGLKLRMPFERDVMKDAKVVVSPLVKTNYETKLLPAFWVDNNKIPPRTKKFDTLLGVNIDFTKLGFNIDVGGVMVNDLKYEGFVNATDIGPGLNFFSKWPLFGPLELSSEITAYYLFALPNNTIQDKLAAGIEGKVWLRVARLYDFSISAMGDFLVASLQNNPQNFAVSSIFGLTLSYGRLFRFLG